MKKISILFVTVFMAFAFSCEKKTEVPEVVLPTNIATEVEVEDAVATVKVSAEKTNFYTITFTENGEATTVESTDGIAAYTFSESGTYSITSKAHTSYDQFIEKTDMVTISIESAPSGAPTTGYETPISQPGYTLVWNDEFNGTDLSSSWTFDIGTGSNGWGNNELQSYTNNNYTVTGGHLKIFAESAGGSYKSTRIKTQGLESWRYGRIDIRAALPYGQGIWPALWMLGDNISTDGWPSCGEIDIMEMIGGADPRDRTVHGTAHWNSNGHALYGDEISLASGKFADEFHVFSIIWDANSIKWLMDDVQYNQLTITAADMTEFHHNFFFIFNVAVGGNWPGSPNASTVFPQSMYVDYVRVFQ